MTRADTLDAFLADAGWGAARRAPLAGDASNRRYLRLHRDGQTTVLMDAPAERGEDVRPFMAVAGHLAGLGLSAPRLLAADPEHGFLLLEDLGDALYLTLAPAQPDLEPLLYESAADALVTLHAAPPLPGLAAYDAARMGTLSGLAGQWYAGDAQAARHLAAACTAALAALPPVTPVMVLRDYHAGNLIWLPERDGPARAGLLDFQDAMLGHPVYDLVSLVQDARRDVPSGIAARTLAHYARQTGQQPEAVARAAAALGAQRALRILGVFARLSLHFGKPGYIALIPRVWDQLHANLADPALAELADVVATTLPPPTPDRLHDLEARCGTIPTL